MGLQVRYELCDKNNGYVKYLGICQMTWQKE